MQYLYCGFQCAGRKSEFVFIEQTRVLLSQHFPHFVELFQSFLICRVFFCEFLTFDGIRVDLFERHFMINLCVPVFQTADLILVFLRSFLRLRSFACCSFCSCQLNLEPGAAAASESGEDTEEVEELRRRLKKRAHCLMCRHG